MKRSWQAVRVMMTAFSLLGSACFLGDDDELRRQGQACAADEQCVSGLICGDVSGQSVCRKPSSLGEACPGGSSGGCEGKLVCSQQQCVEPNSKGAGDACSYNVDCAPGLVCNWGSYTCEPPALVDETCGHPNDCQQGLVCPDYVIGERTCQCATTCAPGLVCGAYGCMPPGSIASGGRCVNNDECQGNSVCVWATKPHVCAPARKLGEACGHPTDCAAGLTCDPYRDVCTPRCEGQAQCKGESWCDLPPFSSEPGMCRPRVEAGEPCSLTLDGAEMCKGSLSCVAPCAQKNMSGDGTCQERLPEGSACVACATSDEEKAAERAEAESGVPFLYDAGCAAGLVCEAGACAKTSPTP